MKFSKSLSSLIAMAIEQKGTILKAVEENHQLIQANSLD